MSTLQDINTLAAEAIYTHGWIQGEMEAEDGSLCLVGALRHCSPQPGDWLIARAVYRRLGHAEEWNDEEGRTEAEVTAWLRTRPITDADIEATFGPQWEAIVRLTRQASTLTREQADALIDASGTTRSDPRAAQVAVTAMEVAGNATKDAARGAERISARSAAWDAAWTAVPIAIWNVAWYVAGVAKALSVADLVGQHGLTQNHIDTLLAPWVSVMGDPRALIARELGPAKADTFLGLLDEHGWTVTRKEER